MHTSNNSSFRDSTRRFLPQPRKILRLPGKDTFSILNPRRMPRHSTLLLKSLEYGLEKSDDSPCRAPVSRLRVEKIEGGLVVAGVVVAANCQIALPIFGCLFVLVGIVLTVASYRGPGQDEAPENYAARLAFTGNSRILGPACITVGFVMLSAGISLCVLTKKARRKEKRVGFHCPIHGDFYPLSPVIASKTLVAHKYKARWSLCFGRARDVGADGICRTPPQCPHTQLSSTRSSFSSMPVSPCPTPMPFLVASTSISSDLANSMGVNVSPDQTFGSIRSLSVSREVASFPLSRTPSPPSPPEKSGRTSAVTKKNSIVVQSENHVTETDENTNNNGGKDLAESQDSDHSSTQSPKLARITTEALLASVQGKSEGKEDGKSDDLWLPPLGKSSRKSVSIILPSEENG